MRDKLFLIAFISVSLAGMAIWLSLLTWAGIKLLSAIV
jgi:hypothetical protein